MAQTVKVEESAFKDAIRALLNTPPTPAAKIVTRNTQNGTAKPKRLKKR